MAAVPLTTLASVKLFLSVTGTAADAFLQDMIPKASAAIENYLQRVVGSATLTETYNGSGSAFLMLRQSPVSSVTSVTVDDVAIPAGAVGQPGWRFLDDHIIGLTGYRFTRGKFNVIVTYTAGYVTIPPEIEQACNEIIGMMRGRVSHLDVSSKSLAGEVISFINSDMNAAAKNYLSSYRRVAQQ